MPWSRRECPSSLIRIYSVWSMTRYSCVIFQNWCPRKLLLIEDWKSSQINKFTRVVLECFDAIDLWTAESCAHKSQLKLLNALSHTFLTFSNAAATSENNMDYQQVGAPPKVSRISPSWSSSPWSCTFISFKVLHIKIFAQKEKPLRRILST